MTRSVAAAPVHRDTASPAGRGEAGDRAAALQAALGPGWLVQWRPQTDSTMTDAAAWADAMGPLAGRWLLCGADEQRRGRGRGDHGFDGAADQTLQITLVAELPRAPTARWPLASLVLGAALQQVLADASGAMVRLKWPNDLVMVVDGAWRKLGGCLAERRERASAPPVWLAGVGVNVRRDGLAADLAANVAALSDSPRGPQRPAPLSSRAGDPIAAAAVACARAARQAVEEFDRRGGAYDHAALTAALAFVGDEVTLDCGGEGLRRGRLRGIDGQGRVVLADGDGERAWLPLALVDARCTPPWQTPPPRRRGPAAT